MADISKIALPDGRIYDIKDETARGSIPTDFVSKASGGTFGGNINVNRQNGTTSTDGTSQIVLGNSTPSGTDKNSAGRLVIYGKGNKFADIKASNVTGDNRNFELPNKSGTLATTDDIKNGKLTLNVTNGTAIAAYEFTANQSGNVTVPITIPNNTVTSFHTVETNFSISLAANGEKTYTPTISLSGWTPIGIIGIYTGNSNVNCIYFKLNNSTQARVDLKNLSNSAVSGTARVQVLYYKNT